MRCCQRRWLIGVLWGDGEEYLYILALPHLDFQAVYSPFYVSVGLMMWAFLSGLRRCCWLVRMCLPLRHALRMAMRRARKRVEPEAALCAFR